MVYWILRSGTRTRLAGTWHWLDWSLVCWGLELRLGSGQRQRLGAATRSHSTVPLVTRQSLSLQDDGDTITAGDMETVRNAGAHVPHNKLLPFALSGDFTAENK